MGFLQKWLEKLAQASKQNFGEERLDCCDLQQKQQKQQKQSSRKQD